MHDKQLMWQQKLEEVDRLTDGIGKGVDAGIKETVAVLQLFGLHTVQSCEGHLTWGEAAPWVDIESLEARALRPKIRELDEHLETLEDDDACERVSEELQTVVQEAKRLHSLELKKIVPYLNEFYRDRHVPFEHRIIIDARGRLTIQGGLLQTAEDHESQARNLREYQQEIDAFTEFLKQKLFS